ncbi:MAG: 1,4-dihydroxy-6-naphthoate synthase [Bacteroidetes bacterium]|nr:1,4-dihydroxy-6-naphthoate synthase [Bacteroidota bacterium]MBU1718862.1 1,4-dihydroxy-6-naphthoate synthase [Bacteroidota bacterium]
MSANDSVITLGFSPCPNDTFIFDALVNHRIDTDGISFDVCIADVEELNRKALQGDLDVSKLSISAYMHVMQQYVLLDSGSAMGFGNGPLLIAMKEIPLEQISSLKIAIPGIYTTANLLFSIAFPEANNKEEYLFSEIEDAVISGNADVGVIIHESRFTYQAKGLKELLDLGAFWEGLSQAPIPLGGIAVRRDMDVQVQRKIERLIRKSIEFARQNPEASKQFVNDHAQVKDSGVTEKHISTFVNDFSISLGEEGRRAIFLLILESVRERIIPEQTLRDDIFVRNEE